MIGTIIVIAIIIIIIAVISCVFQLLDEGDCIGGLRCANTAEKATKATKSVKIFFIIVDFKLLCK